MKDWSDDPSLHEQTLLPQSYTSLPPKDRGTDCYLLSVELKPDGHGNVYSCPRTFIHGKEVSNSNKESFLWTTIPIKPSTTPKNKPKPIMFFLLFFWGGGGGLDWGYYPLHEEYIIKHQKVCIKEDAPWGGRANRQQLLLTKITLIITVLFYRIYDGAYKRTLAANRKE